MATFRLQTATTPAKLVRQLEDEYANFPGPRNVATRRTLHAWTAALLADMAGDEAPLPAFEEMERLEGANMTTISQARLGKWFEDFRAKNVAEGVAQGIKRGVAQGIERGVAEGIEQGLAQGIEQGRTLAHEEGAARLRRQAEIKFGEAAAERLAELLGGKPTTPDLDRVGAWLIECETGAELLARVEALAEPS